MVRRLLPRLVLFGGTTLLLLLTLEIAARLIGLEGRYPAAPFDEVILAEGGPTERLEWGFIPYADLRRTYASNPRGTFEAGNVVHHLHNSQGWRDREHALEAPDSTFRVLGLGDSYLWAQGVRQEDGVLSQLEGLLQADWPEEVEAINTGFPRMNTWWQSSLLQQIGLAYEPDVVVLFFVLNDVEENLGEPGPQLEFFSGYQALYQTSDRLSGVSEFWGWARQRFLRNVRGRKYIQESRDSFFDQSWKWESCADALRTMHAELERRDIPFLMVLFPFFVHLDGDYPFQTIHNRIAEDMASSGVSLLDLRPIYKDFSGPELWVHETDQHPNEIAHRMAAEAVHAWLLEHLPMP